MIIPSFTGPCRQIPLALIARNLNEFLKSDIPINGVRDPRFKDVRRRRRLCILIILLLLVYREGEMMDEPGGAVEEEW